MRSLLLLALLVPSGAHAAGAIQRVPTGIIRPAGSVAPGTILAPNGGDLRDRPSIIIPEGASRGGPQILDSEGKPLRERKDIVVPDQAALDRAVAASPIKAPPIVLDQRQRIDELVAAQSKPTAIEELKAAARKAAPAAAAEAEASEPKEFLAAKSWGRRQRFDIEDKLNLAAKMEPRPRSQAIRDIFKKYGDKLDWLGALELMARLPDDPSAAAVRDHIVEAFLKERAGSMDERELEHAIQVLHSNPAHARKLAKK